MNVANGFDLVTGGSGFLGSHLVRHLRQHNARVRVLDIASPPPDAEPDDFVRGSILDPDALAGALRGARRVFHIAGIAGLWARDKRDYLRINHDGTRAVLEAAAAADVQTVVHCSTAMILMRSPGRYGRVADEDARPGLADVPGAYCRSKLLAENAAFAAAQAGQRVIVVSPTAVVGPGDRGLTPPARMLLGFLNGELPAYLDALLNYVDVRDVAAAARGVAERGSRGRRYVLSGTNIRVSEMLRQLGELSGAAMPRRRVPYWLAYLAALLEEAYADHVSGRPPVASLAGVKLACEGLRFDGERARAELGMTARPLVRTLTDTLADFAERGLLKGRLARLTASDLQNPGAGT